MKRLALMITALVGFSAFAQETNIDNEQTETIITKEYVTDSKGTEVKTKKEKVTATQDIALTGIKNVTPVDTNFNYTMTPTEVNTETTYFNNGQAFRFVANENSYSLMNVAADDGMTSYATLRPSSQKGYYILSQNGTSKFGYFNASGNFVVESYDPEIDEMVFTIYSIKATPEKAVEKKKMK